MDPAAIERFRRHAEGCNECRVNAYGLCETGFALLRGAAACENGNVEGPQGQLALGEMGKRPLVRAYLSRGQEHFRSRISDLKPATPREYRAPYADA